MTADTPYGKRLEARLSERLAGLYAAMEAEYEKVAGRMGFSCAGCPDNCCDSYFQHHTYIEWAYLWDGVMALSRGRRDAIIDRAETVVRESEKVLARGERPLLMCPLNENGLCALYSHRLMICRLHGVSSTLTRPDGRRLAFPGCFRWQELAGPAPSVFLDRTELLRRLADLEKALLGARQPSLPRVSLTLAQMLVQGPPLNE